MNSDKQQKSDRRRNLVLVLSLGLLATCGVVIWLYGASGSMRMVVSATGRIGLALGALWLAWPALRKPANWLPPGFAMLAVGLLAVLAAQPRLVLVLIPAFGGLLLFASIIRSMRQ